MVAHACNPSYVGGLNKGIAVGARLNKKLAKPYLEE
jgi:hypothetical protein